MLVHGVSIYAQLMNDVMTSLAKDRQFEIHATILRKNSMSSSLVVLTYAESC
jgi:hypothetical protein